jgi:SAM-dependent methyltransferase
VGAGVPLRLAGFRTRQGRTGPWFRQVDLGDLHRTDPVSRAYGEDRGLPIDRHYITGFLSRHAEDVRGRVLEIGDDTYTRRYGGQRVTQSDVVNLDEGHVATTIVADLTSADHVPSDTFDSIIFTQTLQLIYDVPAAIRTLHRVLAPGGVLLATFPGISQIEAGRWNDTWYWGFTVASARRLFDDHFVGEVTVESYGNVLAAIAFLEGLATEDVDRRKLDVPDKAYPVTIAVRAVKAPSGR